MFGNLELQQKNAKLEEQIEELEERLKGRIDENRVMQQDFKIQIRDLEANHARQTADLRADHAREIQALNYKVEHAETDTIEELEEENQELAEANAVLIKENEMLERITNLNGDVIDIKKLVTQLIDKLPEIKLSSLTVQNSGSDKK